jgi:hypothetical protein
MSEEEEEEDGQEEEGKEGWSFIKTKAAKFSELRATELNKDALALKNIGRWGRRCATCHGNEAVEEECLSSSEEVDEGEEEEEEENADEEEGEWTTVRSSKASSTHTRGGGGGGSRSIFVPVPSAAFGSVIGRKGATIALLRNDNGCSIDSSEGGFTVKPYAGGSVQVAVDAILRLVDEWAERNSVTLLTEKGEKAAAAAAAQATAPAAGAASTTAKVPVTKAAKRNALRAEKRQLQRQQEEKQQQEKQLLVELVEEEKAQKKKKKKKANAKAAPAPVAPSQVAQQESSEMTEQSTTPMINLEHLPYDVQVTVFSSLPMESMAALACCSKRLRQGVEDGQLWSVLFRSKYPQSKLTARNLADWKHCYQMESRNVSTSLTCFYSKAHFLEPGVVLGMPCKYTVNPKTKEVDYILCSPDLMSVEAFQHLERTNQPLLNSSKERFDLLLPVFLTKDHFSRALPFVKQALKKLAPAGHPGGFDPSLALYAIPRAMNTLTVLISDGASCPEKHLVVFAYLHRLLLAMAEAYPHLEKEAAATLNAFVSNPASQTKYVFCITHFRKIKLPTLRRSFRLFLPA